MVAIPNYLQSDCRLKDDKYGRILIKRANDFWWRYLIIIDSTNSHLGRINFWFTVNYYLKTLFR